MWSHAVLCAVGDALCSGVMLTVRCVYFRRGCTTCPTCPYFFRRLTRLFSLLFFGGSDIRVLCSSSLSRMSPHCPTTFFAAVVVLTLPRSTEFSLSSPSSLGMSGFLHRVAPEQHHLVRMQMAHSWALFVVSFVSLFHVGACADHRSSAMPSGCVHDRGVFIVAVFHWN